MTPPSLAGFQTTIRPQIKRKSTILQCGTQNNDLPLNVSKTKELIVIFRKKNDAKTPSRAEVAQLESCSVLGINMTENLS